MIEKRWLDSLNDPDPEIRKQAVRAITNSGSDDAMIHLAKVYRTDTDPEVQEMARQGGIKLRQMGYRVGSSEPEQRDRYEEDAYDPMAGLYETPLQEERPPRRDIPTEPIQKPKRSHDDNASTLTWTSVTPDLLLYLVIVTVGTFIVMMVLVESMKPVLEDIFDESSPAELTEIRAALEGSSTAFIGSSLVSGVLAVGALVFQIWIIHYLATSSFGGYGNMFAFLRKYAIASAVLSVILSGIGIYFLITTFAAVPELAQSTTTTSTATLPEDYLSTITTLCCGIFFGLFAVAWYFGRLISQHYSIGLWAGIGSFIVAVIAAQIAMQVLSNFIFTYI